MSTIKTTHLQHPSAASPNLTLAADGSIANFQWTDYTPTITSGAGTLGSYSITFARYQNIGQTTIINMRITITNNGTGANDIRFTLPRSARANGSGHGYFREGGLTGNMGSVEMNNTTTAICRLYNNSYPGGTNALLDIIHIYEAA